MIQAKSFLYITLIISVISLISNQDQIQNKTITNINTENNNNNNKNNSNNLNFLNNENESKEKDTYELFLNFIATNGKSYSSIEEFNKRFQAFKENLKNVGFENKKENQNINDKKQAIQLPKFIDISQEEFRSKYLKLKIHLKPKNQTEKKKPRNLQKENQNKEKKEKRNLQELPKSFDWRNFGKVSSVKEQGECGVCWAFAAAANLESLYAIKYNKILDLSEEQMLDCDSVNNGCDGGNMEDAFKYLNKAGGLMREADYKYTQIKDRCKFNIAKSVVQVRGWKVLDTNDEDEIARILMEKGPLSIGINADNLQLHQKGIYDESKQSCPVDNLNHAVLIVGFGEEQGEKYWIIKNSWGENWADNGFFKISRGKGTCGINLYVVYGKLA
jgi:cathepsin F